VSELLDTIRTEPDVRKIGQSMMRTWFDSIRKAKAEGRPVAYVFVMGAMADLLRCFDFELVFPEISSLQSAVRKQAPQYFRTAESAGYPVDICNYVKADVGMWLQGGQHAMGQMPSPDLVLSNHLCGVYIKWAEIYERMFDCRSFVFDIPFYRSSATAGVLDSPERASDRKWVAAQIDELIEVCQEITGTPFDADRLAEVEGYRNEMADLYAEILEINRRRPAAFDVFDEGTVIMGNMNAWRGTREGVEYLRRVRDDLAARADAGVSPIGEERFRLLVSGLVPWMAWQEFMGLFHDRGGVFVSGDYLSFATEGFDRAGIRYDVSRPVPSLADVTLAATGNGCGALIFADLILPELATTYAVDGIVYHCIKSCRTVSTTMPDNREYFARAGLDVPSLYIESDHMDARYWSGAQLKNRVDAFFEVLESRALTRTGG
jgi:benzoyl-CoA reductase subunit B